MIKIDRKLSNDLNEIWDNSEYPTTLKPLSWEESAHAEAGRPQEVIMKQLPLAECDIFIGILWRRFGTPTGTNRSQDGKPYLSGTEQEIEEAFTLWKNTGRPVIMLYRKTNPLPASMREEEMQQFNRVNEFFRQCEPGGEHPALVKEFDTGSFEKILRNDLARVVSYLNRDSIKGREKIIDSASYASAGEPIPVDGAMEVKSKTEQHINVSGVALSDAYSHSDLLGYSDYVDALAILLKVLKHPNQFR